MSDFDFVLRKQLGTEDVCFESTSNKGRDWSMQVCGAMADPVFSIDYAPGLAAKLIRAGYKVNVAAISDDLLGGIENY
jgi:hypothetical protein